MNEKLAGTKPTVLITGTSRGLGLEFVRQYAAKGWRVHACGRPAASAEIAGVKGDVTYHQLDATDWSGLAALARALDGEAIDVLLANAGMIGRTPNETTEIDPVTWIQTVTLNALAPMKLAQAFREHVARSNLKKMVAISTVKASLQLSEGNDPTYRASKAALNAGWRSMAMNVKGRGISCVLFHPGWVQTDMGGPNAPVTRQDSVAGMMAVIDKMTPETTGEFRNFDGAMIPW